MDLLNLSKPWDCESFPKSKNICYGGGGGGGGLFSNPIQNIVKAVSNPAQIDLTKAVPKMDVDIPEFKMPDSIKDTALGPLADASTNIVNNVTESVKSLGSGVDLARSDLGSGAIEDAVKDFDVNRSDLGSGAVQKTVEKTGQGITGALEGAVKGITEPIGEAIERSDFGSGAVEESLARSDFGSGAISKFDLGGAINDAYQGSDIDKTLEGLTGDGLPGGGLPSLTSALPGDEPKSKSGGETGTGLSALQKSQLAKRRSGFGRRQTFLT